MLQKWNRKKVFRFLVKKAFVVKSCMNLRKPSCTMRDANGASVPFLFMIRFKKMFEALKSTNKNCAQNFKIWFVFYFLSVNHHNLIILLYIAVVIKRYKLLAQFFLIISKISRLQANEIAKCILHYVFRNVHMYFSQRKPKRKTSL